MGKPKNQMTAETARHFFNYDPETGVLRWKVSTSNRVAAGSIAGTLNSIGYRQIWLHGKSYVAHRIAWAIVNGAWPEQEIDHVNGIRDDNRKANLREASHAENSQNRALQGNNSSGHTGVSWCSRARKWRAEIRANGQHWRIGSFSDIADAIAARRKAKAEIHTFNPIDRALGASADGYARHPVEVGGIGGRLAIAGP